MIRYLIVLLFLGCATLETPPVPGGYPVSCEESLETCMENIMPNQNRHHAQVMCRIQYEECRRSRTAP